MDKITPTTRAINAGFSLLETLVALAILMAAMLGPMTLASNSIRSASLSHNTAIASFLAEEAMEIARAERDGNVYRGAGWLAGISGCTVANPCTADIFRSTAIQACGASCPKLKYNSQCGIYGYGTGCDAYLSSWADSIFTRTLSVENVGDGSKEIKVKITVEWKERFLLTNSSLELDASLMNWK